MERPEVKNFSVVGQIVENCSLFEEAYIQYYLEQVNSYTID
jgi:hypothetical protein